ncbi:alpha/beta hydrolase fold domain-containing protein [Luteimicrobium sp. DT211]|uniref:alpha/beta hydrolase fold domain-containing protein n=1 Tax=Luteimicrobium sp. DT211 TaxID=3393412 RepID=UPI003CF5845D
MTTPTTTPSGRALGARRTFLAELEDRRHLVAHHPSYADVPAEDQALWKAPFGPPEDWDVDTFDTTFDGPHGPVPVRVYVPGAAPPPEGRPGLVWIHGGAFSFGDLDMPEADATARGVAGRAGAVVVSVDYRLCPVPPELGGGGDERVDSRGAPVRFPVPHDDCLAAYTAVRDRADALGVDRDRLAIGGASAGGCLAAGAALRLADEGRAPWQLLLVYAVLHPTLPDPEPELTEALASVPPALLFATGARDAINGTYLGDAVPTPYAYAGIAPDLSGLPPTYVENAEFDVLRASGERFARQLRSAGVDVESHVRRGVPHGHLDCVGLGAAAATMDALAGRLAPSDLL